MARRFLPMITRVEHQEEGLTVFVEHDERQSFTRSVQPRAFRDAGSAQNRSRQLVCVSAYCHDDPKDQPGRCESVYEFRYQASR